VADRGRQAQSQSVDVEHVKSDFQEASCYASFHVVLLWYGSIHILAQLVNIHSIELIHNTTPVDRRRVVQQHAWITRAQRERASAFHDVIDVRFQRFASFLTNAMNAPPTGVEVAASVFSTLLRVGVYIFLRIVSAGMLYLSSSIMANNCVCRSPAPSPAIYCLRWWRDTLHVSFCLLLLYRQLHHKWRLRQTARRMARN
jgi:hypothetical protein